MAERKGLHFSVREATLSDAVGILDCLQTAFEPYRPSYTPEAFGDTALTPETVNDRLAAMTVFVATDDAGTVIGTVGGKIVAPTEGHLRGMAVRPEWQGCGVAEHLVRTVETHLHSRGCSRITLNTSEPLQRARRFYEKHGYQSSGRVFQKLGMQLFEHVKRN
jgi:GNAT superfamily N-acetyltransferase